MEERAQHGRLARAGVAQRYDDVLALDSVHTLERQPQASNELIKTELQGLYLILGEIARVKILRRQLDITEIYVRFFLNDTIDSEPIGRDLAGAIALVLQLLL